MAASESEPKAGTNSPSIMLWVALPPAPWDIVTWLSRNFAALASGGLDDAQHLLLAGGRGGVERAHTTSRSRAKRP